MRGVNLPAVPRRAAAMHESYKSATTCTSILRLSLPDLHHGLRRSKTVGNKIRAPIILAPTSIWLTEFLSDSATRRRYRSALRTPQSRVLHKALFLRDGYRCLCRNPADPFTDTPRTWRPGRKTGCGKVILAGRLVIVDGGAFS